MHAGNTAMHLRMPTLAYPQCHTPVPGVHYACPRQGVAPQPSRGGRRSPLLTAGATSACPRQGGAPSEPTAEGLPLLQRRVTSAGTLQMHVRMYTAYLQCHYARIR